MAAVKKKKAPSRRSLSKMPSSYPDINMRFVETRRRAGLTQADVAKMIRVNLSTIKKIELGDVVPNIYVIRQWHKYFKDSYGWIIDGDK